MNPLFFYKAAFGVCLLLLLVSCGALAAARRKGAEHRIRVLHFLRAGLGLSAVSHLLRGMGAIHHDRLSFLSFITCFLGTMFLWLGWMEQWKMRVERSNTRIAPFDEEDGRIQELLPMPSLAVGIPPLTARAHQVLHHAQEEACRRHECCVDTEHLLLGLLRASGSAGVHVLHLLGAETEKLHLELLGQMASCRKFTKQRGQTSDTALRTSAGPLELTDRASQVLILAARESHRFDKTFVGTEHLLLGLVLAGKGKAAAVLFGEGVTVDGIRDEIIKAKKAAV